MNAPLSLSQRRWQIFRANRRSWWSLWLFLILFSLSLFAEFFANDEPILLSYRGEYYFPVLHDYAEKDLLEAAHLKARSTILTLGYMKKFRATAGCSGR
jgi:ABC-type uncharacterized transport system, permease component